MEAEHQVNCETAVTDLAQARVSQKKPTISVIYQFVHRFC